MMQSRFAGLFLFTLAGCVAHRSALTPPIVEDEDLRESNVLTAVIEGMTRHSETTIEILPVGGAHAVARTYGNRFAAAFGIPEDSLSPADSEAEKDFDRRNADSGWKGVPLKLHTPYRWITREEFRAAGLRPIISVSRVGFSHDYRAALVDVGYHCGPLCGSGSFVFLERDATNAWRVSHRYQIWYA